MAAERLVGLDVLKGLLTCKIAAAHLFALAGFGVLYKPVSIGKPFTFGVLLFCFGLGLGLSTRRRDARPLATLLGAYLMGSLVILMTLGVGEMRFSGVSVSELVGLVSFRVATPYVEYVLPFAFYYSLILLFQLFGVRLRVLHWAALLALGLIIHWAGVYANRLAPDAVGSVFYAEGFRTLQYAPVFFTGLAAAQYRQWLVPSDQVSAVWIWLALALLLAINILSPHILRAMDMTLLKFRGLGSLRACLVIVLVAVAEVGISEGLARRYAESSVVRYFGRVGRRLPLSLMIQVLTVPLVALWAQRVGAPLGYLVALLYMAAFLVLLDRWPRPKSLGVDPAAG